MAAVCATAAHCVKLAAFVAHFARAGATICRTAANENFCKKPQKAPIHIYK